LALVISASRGGSGAFSDNTVAVTKQNQVFVVGGGRTTEEGSLVALDLEAGAAGPQLKLRWFAPIPSGSATSPAFTKEGTRAVLGDGARNIVYLDIDSCNKNTDANTKAGECAPLWTYKLRGESILGSMGIDDDGVVYAWDSSTNPADPDALALRSKDGKPEVVWERSFASAQDVANQVDTRWNSSVTVFNNLVVGSISRLQEPLVPGSPIPIYKKLSHEVVALDRATGAVVWRQPLSDDCINSPAVGPDGAIFIPKVGMLDIIAATTSLEYTGGIQRFTPAGWK
jgi:outer membrane protein assembly factor BamB